MYECKCKMCGAVMVARTQHQLRSFCGKKCYGAYNHLKANDRKLEVLDQDQPRSRYIHPAGYENLVCAIVRQAREDVLSFAPTNLIRQDAEDFFLSEYFEQLTNLDGFEILYRLTEKYNEKHKRKKGVRA